MLEEVSQFLIRWSEDVSLTEKVSLRNRNVFPFMLSKLPKDVAVPTHPSPQFSMTIAVAAASPQAPSALDTTFLVPPRTTLHGEGFSLAFR